MTPADLAHNIANDHDRQRRKAIRKPSALLAGILPSLQVRPHIFWFESAVSKRVCLRRCMNSRLTWRLCSAALISGGGMTGSRGTKSRLWHLAGLSAIKEALKEAFISLTRVRPCRADHGVTDLKLLADDDMLLSIIRPISSDVLHLLFCTSRRNIVATPALFESSAVLNRFSRQH